MRVTIDPFSPESLMRAAKKVRAYENKVLDNNKTFLKDLAYIGILKGSWALQNVAEDYEAPDFSTLNPHVMNGDSKGEMSVTLRLQGEQAVFVEFGAGVHYNGSAGTSPNPWGVELGYTIGGYGMGQGQNDSWEYQDESGKYHVTHGTPAAMPLYHASVAINQSARVIAMTDFRSY